MPSALPRPRSVVAAGVGLALALTADAQAPEADTTSVPTATPVPTAASETARPLGADPAPPEADSAVVWAPAPGVFVVAASEADLAGVLEPSAVLVGTGRASYYGERFRGRRTANGERFNPDRLTAAHRTLPFGTRLRVTNLRTGRSVVVRVNDRGPFHGNRVIDLSKEAARRIGMVRSGTARVRIEKLP